MQLPDEDTCLDNLFVSRFGGKPCSKCQQHTKFYRIKGRKCFQCDSCLHQVYPMKGTIMERSTTELRKWLTVIHEMMVAKTGVSMVEISIRIGVTYKCAFRMCHKIRSAMADDNLGELAGIIEVDETYVGGKRRNKAKKPKFNSNANKIIVMGIYQRSGNIKLCVVGNTGEDDLIPFITSNVVVGSTIYSDENAVYKKLPGYGYLHKYITHKNEEWARGPVTTNRIEGCWSRFKNTIRGTYVHISGQYMESYLREYEFRHNNRKETNLQKFLILTGLIGFDLSEAFLGTAGSDADRSKSA
jgi:transposase